MKQWCLCLLLCLAICGCNRFEILQTYCLPENYSLTVLAERSWEYQQCLYYIIKRDGGECVPLTLFGVAANGTALNVIDSGYGVVGLAQKSQPEKIVVLFDVKSKASWPYRGPNELAADAQERGERLLAILKTATGNSALELGD
jgi:hypothetical protein